MEELIAALAESNTADAQAQTAATVRAQQQAPQDLATSALK
jgi:hypothetical protein